MEEINGIKIKYTKHGYVDLTKLKYANNHIKWDECTNTYIPFLYDGIHGNMKVLSSEGYHHVNIEYNDDVYKITRIGLTNGFFDKIIHKQKYDFCYNIGDVLMDNKRNLKIVNRKTINGKRYYNCLCNNCNYLNNVNIIESDLKLGYGCPVCSNHRMVVGYNDFNTIYPELSQFIINEEDKHIQCKSRKVISWECPMCNGIIYDSPNHVLTYGLICNHCSTKYSFAENVMCNILESLNVKYEKGKVFEWSSRKNKELSGNRIYDFYIPSLNCIIEVHGEQHYSHPRGNWTKRTLEEEQQNDRLKYNLALQNGISHYIVIDCKKSTIKWIKESVMSNIKFCELFDTNLIDWGKVASFKIDDTYKKVCELWNNGMSIGNIATELKIDRHKVKDLLSLSIENNHTNYSHDIAVERGAVIVGSKKAKPIYCIETNQYFQSIALCEKISEQIFGIKLTNNNMSRQINKNKKHKGYTFKYVTKEEFNNAKKEFPNNCFGDFFN